MLFMDYRRFTVVKSSCTTRFIEKDTEYLLRFLAKLCQQDPRKLLSHGNIMYPLVPSVPGRQRLLDIYIDVTLCGGFSRAESYR